MEDDPKEIIIDDLLDDDEEDATPTPESPLDDIGPIDDEDEVEIIDSETEHDDDEPEVEDPIDFEHDLFDETELEEAQRDAATDEEEAEEELDPSAVLAKLNEGEFTCTRCYLIRDGKYLSSESKKKAPYCIYCE